MGWARRCIAQRHKLIVASAFTALLASVILGGVALRIRFQAAAQARLAQRLGQEITKMEWLLRSARQLPLHDLNREKVLVRARMAALQSDLAAYGTVGQPLAHYALGRGHMALHEYPQALTELQRANAMGLQTPDLHYALGIVLGKHFEQAMYEARLSGGGDWAKKQLKQFEPKFLTPAIDSLQKSRAVQLDAPEYLEALIAYYQRDYERSLSLSQSALKTAPWLYESSKLAGDVHLDRALRARDSGKYEEAEKEFAASVKEYEAAAAIGQSDAEVYEGLAESWVRQVEMARDRGQDTEPAYQKAMSVADQISAADARSVVGKLKQAFAAFMFAGTDGSGSLNRAVVQNCIEMASYVLMRDPENMFAMDVMGNCQSFMASIVKSDGGDPVPFLASAVSVLTSAVTKNPRFLWALNDLAVIYSDFADYSMSRGFAFEEHTMKSIKYFESAHEIDAEYVGSVTGLLWVTRLMIHMPEWNGKIDGVIMVAEMLLKDCTSITVKDHNCYDNYFQVVALGPRPLSS